jgi:tetratricopeptide (TPR) repeat protein
MRMDGLVQKVVPYKGWGISPTNLEKNIFEVYKYRGLDDPDVYYDKTIRNILQNYRSAYLQLAKYYVRDGKKKEMRKVLEFMDEKISPEVISWNATPLLLRATKNALWITSGVQADSILKDINSDKEMQVVGEELMRMGRYDEASNVLKLAFENNPSNVRLLGLLINSNQLSGKEKKSIEPLKRWIKDNPTDVQAKRMLKSIEKDS